MSGIEGSTKQLCGCKTCVKSSEACNLCFIYVLPIACANGVVRFACNKSTFLTQEEQKVVVTRRLAFPADTFLHERHIAIGHAPTFGWPTAELSYQPIRQTYVVGIRRGLRVEVCLRLIGPHHAGLKTRHGTGI